MRTLDPEMVAALRARHPDALILASTESEPLDLMAIYRATTLTKIFAGVTLRMVHGQ